MKTNTMAGNYQTTNSEISIVKEYPTDDHFLVERNPL